MSGTTGAGAQHATVTQLLASAELAHEASADGKSATFVVRSAANGDPTALVATAIGTELVLRTAVKPCRRPHLRQLQYLNEWNLWSQGIVAAWNPTQEVIELRGSIPNAPSHAPHGHVVGALASTMHALVPMVAAERMPTDSESAALLVDDEPPPGGLGFDLAAHAFLRVMPMVEQADGSYAGFCRYDVGSFQARLSWSRFAGLVLDAVGPGDPPFSFDQETLARIAQLNAHLAVGGVALWGDAKQATLVFRRAVPLLWLSMARDEGATLVSYDFIKSTLDNASAAWEDIERIWRGGSIQRP